MHLKLVFLKYKLVVYGPLCMSGVIQTRVSTWESVLKISTSSHVTVVQLVTPGQCATSVSVLLSVS